ncbi:MAG: stage 0 sporulation family protein [Clostridia bacterium]|nr:stage 0 sporulation family protein [Clostridia bacterium]
MAMVVKVRFRRASKLYDFDANGLEVSTGSYIVTETVRGMEIGECMGDLREVQNDQMIAPLKPILRIATQEDLNIQRENEEREKQALETAELKVQELKLDMKLVDVEFAFDRSKITFYFTADGRVDFRILVKNLASVFKTRIELRQIGVRDEAKMLGGLGPCGRPICCRQFLADFQPVSIKMATEQNLSLNPTKISGICDRLMCCLKYEQDHYESTRKRMPKIGRELMTPDGIGVITAINVLSETVTVRLTVGDSFENRVYAIDDCQRLDGGRPAPKDVEPVEEKKAPPVEAVAAEPVMEAAPETEPEEDRDDEADTEKNESGRAKRKRRHNRRGPRPKGPAGENGERPPEPPRSEPNRHKRPPRKPRQGNRNPGREGPKNQENVRPAEQGRKAPELGG